MIAAHLVEGIAQVVALDALHGQRQAALTQFFDRVRADSDGVGGAATAAGGGDTGVRFTRSASAAPRLFARRGLDQRLGHRRRARREHRDDGRHHQHAGEEAQRRGEHEPRRATDGRRVCVSFDELHLRALADHGRELQRVPVGQPHAAVRRGVADGARLRRAVDAVVRLADVDPHHADGPVRARAASWPWRATGRRPRTDPGCS